MKKSANVYGLELFKGTSCHRDLLLTNLFNDNFDKFCCYYKKVESIIRLHEKCKMLKTKIQHLYYIDVGFITLGS